MNALKTVATILLIVFPFSTILSRFSPYLTKYTFNDFLLASLAFAIVSISLGLFIRHEKNKPAFTQTGGLSFFLLGVAVAPPLMLGPPEVTALLVQRTTEEHFRYGLLLVAIILFSTGLIFILRASWASLHAVNKGILLPFVAALVLSLWDNFSSYHFSSELTEWIKAGKDADAFFPRFDFHEEVRTSGRMLIYVTVLWLGFILLKNGSLSKWVFTSLAVFCATGIISFFALIITGDGAFYFLLIPAIALAPAYWMGIALISRKSLTPKL